MDKLYWYLYISADVIAIFLSIIFIAICRKVNKNKATKSEMYVVSCIIVMASLFGVFVVKNSTLILDKAMKYEANNYTDVVAHFKIKNKDVDIVEITSDQALDAMLLKSGDKRLPYQRSVINKRMIQQQWNKGVSPVNSIIITLENDQNKHELPHMLGKGKIKYIID